MTQTSEAVAPASYTRGVAEGQSSRERILDVTIGLLESDGEAGIRIDQVAEQAQVAKRSIYHFFTDREGLIIAAQSERLHRMMFSDFRAVIDGLLDCVTLDDYVRLLLTGVSSSTHHAADRRRLRLQILGSADTRPELKEVFRAAHRSLVEQNTKVVAFGQRRGWVQTTYSASTIAEWWFALATGRYLTETYADAADVESVGNANIDAASYILFGRTFPEYSSQQPTPES